MVKKVVSDKDNNWYKLIYSLWTDIDADVRNKPASLYLPDDLKQLPQITPIYSGSIGDWCYG